VSRSLRPRSWSLARQLLALQIVVITVLVLGGGFAAYIQAVRASTNAAREKVLGVAVSLAAQPTVREALTLGDPSAVLQPLSVRVQLETGTDFVVVMNVLGTRYSHPNPDLIGGTFSGHIEAAVRGEQFTETYAGSLGPSVRAVVPVWDNGKVVGLVSAGIRTSAVDRALRAQIPLLLLAAAAALLLAMVGSWLISRWLRRQTHDLGPAELARMYEFYDAVLHAVREGLLLLDREGRLQLVNDEARRLLGIGDDAIGRRIDDVGLPAALGTALATGTDRTDEIHLAGDRVLVLNQAPAHWDATVLGTVVTLRDHTDLQALTGELDSVRGFAEALRSQAHEAANRLHTVVSLIELGRTEQALTFAAAEGRAAQHLTDRLVGAVREPVLAALLLGKTAQANERGVELVVEADSELSARVIAPGDLVTIVGNLLDNAIDAAVGGEPPRRVSFSARETPAELVLRVADSGPGLDDAEVRHAFERGWSTKPDDRNIGRGLGLALVGQAVRRYGGTIDVGRDVLPLLAPRPEVAGGPAPQAGVYGGAVFTVRLPMP
jgi:two-component system CitB family sensor kinase